eukprot:scaffold79099_cov34-Phaeocystis_antarctica.AAC.4
MEPLYVALWSKLIHAPRHCALAVSAGSYKLLRWLESRPWGRLAPCGCGEPRPRPSSTCLRQGLALAPRVVTQVVGSRLEVYHTETR